MQDTWREKGLVVVGVHVKPSVHEEALALCRRNGINFPVFNTGYVALKGVDGTPTVYFFDASGEQVHKGAFAGHRKELEALLEKAPDWVAGSRQYVHVAEEAAKIRSRTDMGGAAASLREKSKAEEAPVREEAAHLLGRLVKFADGLFRRAEARAASGYPREALDLWKKISRDFEGDEICERAVEAEKKRVDDPTFQRELDALKSFRMIEKLALRLKPRRPGQPEESWRKRNQTILYQLRAARIALAKKFGDTRVCARAGEFIRSLGVD